MSTTLSPVRSNRASIVHAVLHDNMPIHEAEAAIAELPRARFSSADCSPQHAFDDIALELAIKSDNGRLVAALLGSGDVHPAMMINLLDRAGVNYYKTIEEPFSGQPDSINRGEVKAESVQAIIDSSAFENWVKKSDSGQAQPFTMLVGQTSLSPDDKSDSINAILRRAEKITGRDQVVQAISSNHAGFGIGPVQQAFSEKSNSKNFVAIAQYADQSTIDKLLLSAVHTGGGENMHEKIDYVIDHASMDVKARVAMLVNQVPDPSGLDEYLIKRLPVSGKHINAAEDRAGGSWAQGAGS